MAQKLEDWIETHVKKFEKYDIGTMSNILFFREETRPQFTNPNYFYSPADGTILYTKVVTKDEAVLEVKGANFSLKDITLNKIDYKYDRYLVIGVFMTFYDLHVNRIPLGGILSFKEVDPIKSYNMPMIFVEKGLFNGNSLYALKNTGRYMKYNQRMINRVYNNKHDLEYWMVQIADEEVDVITHFTTTQGDQFGQNDRFSFIRWGSQVDLIIPLVDHLDFTILQQPLYHVKAGLDKLVEIKKK